MKTAALALVATAAARVVRARVRMAKVFKEVIMVVSRLGGESASVRFAPRLPA
jgi:hypothetical protein